MHFKLKLLKENFLRPVMDESGVAAINCLLLNYAQDICHAVSTFSICMPVSYLARYLEIRSTWRVSWTELLLRLAQM